MNKLVCVVGPTATGKTKKAIEFSKEQSSILISADSRQVYKGMDIVTGKDHPKDLKIFGIDLVNPDESCSVAVWYDAVMSPVNQAWKAGQQVIVVGGTGLYVKALTEGIETMQVPVDDSLRIELNALSIPELQEKLSQVDKSKFDGMNHSDSLNSRRLIRAIEVASYKGKIPPKTKDQVSSLIGLNPTDSIHYQELVHQRVLSRIDLGAIEETEKLLKKYSPTIQSMSAIGYKSITKYLTGALTKDQLIENWVADEIAYSKRQLTWFRKQPVIWYDVD